MNKDAIYIEYEETKKLLDSLSPKLALWQETYKKLCALDEKINYLGKEHLKNKNKNFKHYAGEPFVAVEKKVLRKDKKILKKFSTPEEILMKKNRRKEKIHKKIVAQCKKFWDKIKKDNPHLPWNKE